MAGMRMTRAWLQDAQGSVVEKDEESIDVEDDVEGVGVAGDL